MHLTNRVSFLLIPDTSVHTDSTEYRRCRWYTTHTNLWITDWQHTTIIRIIFLTNRIRYQHITIDVISIPTPVRQHTIRDCELDNFHHPLIVDNSIFVRQHSPERAVRPSTPQTLSILVKPIRTPQRLLQAVYKQFSVTSVTFGFTFVTPEVTQEPVWGFTSNSYILDSVVSRNEFPTILVAKCRLTIIIDYWSPFRQLCADILDLTLTVSNLV